MSAWAGELPLLQRVGMRLRQSGKASVSNSWSLRFQIALAVCVCSACADSVLRGYLQYRNNLSQPPCSQTPSPHHREVTSIKHIIACVFRVVPLHGLACALCTLQNTSQNLSSRTALSSKERDPNPRTPPESENNTASVE